MSHDPLIHKAYRGTTRLAGPLLFVENAADLPFGGMVTIAGAHGADRSGQVIEVSEDVAIIQVLEQTMGLDLETTTK